MAFELPELPYAYDALNPFMSAETLEFHHDKHHNAYVTVGNGLAADAGMSDKSLEEVVLASFGNNAPLFNNASQHLNHMHFWKWMKPNGGGKSMSGALEAKINEIKTKYPEPSDKPKRVQTPRTRQQSSQRPRQSKSSGKRKSGGRPPRRR